MTIQPANRLYLKNLKAELSAEFSSQKNIQKIMRKQVQAIDQLLIGCFHNHHLQDTFCLLAQGSYGRNELQLHSDIDLLILHEESVSDADLNAAQNFVQNCWDMGLEIGHQITTVEKAAELAAKDLTVISSMLDLRRLCGRGNLMEYLIYKTHPLHMWDSHPYFFAKLQEQQLRYEKYGETAYNLEPNIKYGAGGLRDIQLLLQIGKRHFGIKTLAEGIKSGFITSQEYEELNFCQHFLWRVRYALHMLAGKREDRLLFDYQIQLAALFSYKDKPHSLAIEQFMKSYFKVIKRSRELNEILLQWFSESIVYQQKQKLRPLDKDFRLANQYLESRPALFIQKPSSLLSIFLWIAKQPEIEGIRADTIRQIRAHLYLIDKNFCESKEATELFMAILRSEHNPYQALRNMSRYGVLGCYLDCFAAVTGQMQYDLFHVYTVDQHSLFVIRNIGRFAESDYAKQFPLAAILINQIDRRYILYLAALFHDIAKGRGGDHSVLGAIEAELFAKRHHLSDEDSHLLCWLVQEHLLLSQTAQRKDIHDPKTIQDFCKKLPKPEYLEYLYLLTVADICGTNPALWNSWKDHLLRELYYAAKNSLEQTASALDENRIIQLRKKQSLLLLQLDNIPKSRVLDLWKDFKGKYFLRETAESISRQTRAILNCKEFPLVDICSARSLGGTEIFIYMPHRDDRFALTTTVLSNQQKNIQEASIISCDNQYDLDRYIILDESSQSYLSKAESERIKTILTKALQPDSTLPEISQRRMHRAHNHFKTPIQIHFEKDSPEYSNLLLIAQDRPGLLACISRVFYNEQINLHGAKISTAGERVEDLFYLSSKKALPLTADEKSLLRNHLIAILESELTKK